MEPLPCFGVGRGREKRFRHVVQNSHSGSGRRHAKKIWGKGQHLPPEYRDVYFQDWERYDLGPAPAGYRWVRVERDAYLVEVTSGLIAQAMIGVLLD